MRSPSSLYPITVSSRASSSGTRRNASPIGRVSEMSTDGMPEIRASSARDDRGLDEPPVGQHCGHRPAARGRL